MAIYQSVSVFGGGWTALQSMAVPMDGIVILTLILVSVIKLILAIVLLPIYFNSNGVNYQKCVEEQEVVKRELNMYSTWSSNMVFMHGSQTNTGYYVYRL